MLKAVRLGDCEAIRALGPLQGYCLKRVVFESAFGSVELFKAVLESCPGAHRAVGPAIVEMCRRGRCDLLKLVRSRSSDYLHEAVKHPKALKVLTRGRQLGWFRSGAKAVKACLEQDRLECLRLLNASTEDWLAVLPSLSDEQRARLDDDRVGRLRSLRRALKLS